MTIAEKKYMEPKELDFTLLKNTSELEIGNEYLKVIFMLEGNGWLFLEGNENLYGIAQDDVFVINSFQISNLTLAADAKAIMLSISPTFMKNGCPEVISPKFNCKSFLYDESGQTAFNLLRASLAKVFRAYYKNESEYSVHLRSQVMALLDVLYQNFFGIDDNNFKESSREGIKAAIDYIHENYRKKISLADLSAHTFLSEPYISRIFSKYVRMTFTTYLNRVRLLEATALIGSDKSITEIAYASGFPTTTAFINAFKKHHGLTPGKYRLTKDFKKIYKHQANKITMNDEGYYTAFVDLMKYADTQTAGKMKHNPNFEITVDVKAGGKKLKHYWKNLINAGYAHDVLDNAKQEQLKSIQQTIGFKYIRCKGILDDDMLLYTKDIDGGVTTNYVYLDQVIDFILSVDAKPMLEFGHMPRLLAKNPIYSFKRPVCLSGPKDIRIWKELITGVMEHLKERYGVDELKEWFFAPWFAIDFHAFGLFDLEDYAAVYQTSYAVIKKISPDLIVCGPGSTLAYPKLRKWFVDMAKAANCFPDIFSVRSFAAIDPKEEANGMDLSESKEALCLAVSADESYVEHMGEEVKAFLTSEGIENCSIIVDEWSNNIWQRDLCNDTAYKSTYIFKNVLENYDCFSAMGYFNASDRLDEIGPVAEMFHGGFGLFTQNGLPKSAYRAMQLLNKVGDKLIAQGDGYFISVANQSVQIFLYNYSHYDMLYRYRNTTNLTKTERYQVFNESQPKSYYFNLNGLSNTTYRIKRYRIGKNGGSTYDAWIKMGAPEPLTNEERQLLILKSYPEYCTKKIVVNKSLKLKAYLEPHEILLITISK